MLEGGGKWWSQLRSELIDWMPPSSDNFTCQFSALRCAGTQIWIWIWCDPTIWAPQWSRTPRRLAGGSPSGTTPQRLQHPPLIPPHPQTLCINTHRWCAKQVQFFRSFHSEPNARWCAARSIPDPFRGLGHRVNVFAGHAARGRSDLRWTWPPHGPCFWSAALVMVAKLAAPHA